MGQDLRVRVLGAAELAVDGRPLVGLASAKATALLVYLAVTGTAQSRSALAGLLWSDLPEATARANLRLALTKLRRALPGRLLVTRQTVALDPALPVWVDAVEVERLATGKPEGEELLAATRLCRGDFLSGFEAPGAELFDEWVLGRRAASRADQLALLERAVQDARDREDAATGVEVARRMLELEPLHEEAHRALMWFLATGGRRGAALAQFEICRYLLREELGQDPSPATVALRDQITLTGEFTNLPSVGRVSPPRGGAVDRAFPPRGGGVESPAPRPGGGAVDNAGRRTGGWATLPVGALNSGGLRSGAPGAPGVGAAAAGAAGAGAVGAGWLGAPGPLTSLIGREEDLARLHALLDDPACRLVTLVGPGGIGKTRLALEAGGEPAGAASGRGGDGVVRRDQPGAAGGGGRPGGDQPGRRPGGVAGGAPRPARAAGRRPRRARAAAGPGQPGAAPRRRRGAGRAARPGHRGVGPGDLAAAARARGRVAGRGARPALPAARGGRGRLPGRAAVRGPGPAAPARVPAGRRPGRRRAGLPAGGRDPAGHRAGRPLGPLRLPGGHRRPPGRRRRAAGHHRPRRGAAPPQHPLGDRLVLGAARRGRAPGPGPPLGHAGRLRPGRGRRRGRGRPAAAGRPGRPLPGRAGRGRALQHARAAAPVRRPAPGRRPGRAGRGAAAPRHPLLRPAPRPGPAAPDGSAELDTDVENLRAATDWLVAHGDPPELDRHLDRLWQLYRRRGWFREAQAALGAALRRREVPAPLRARWHRLLAEAHVQLGEMRQARDHFERTLALLGTPLPASKPGWSDVLASQALQRPLRRLRPGGRVARSEAERRWAAEPAAVCWQLQEACWMLEDQTPLIPLALWAVNLSERAGRPDLLMMNQAGLGNSLTAAGLRRLARSYVRAAVAAADRSSDPVAISWTYIVATLHWLAVGDWAAIDAGLPRALKVATGARLHRVVDEIVLLAGIGRYLTGRFEEAAAMGADARAAARDRRDPMAQLWGILVVAEAGLRADPGHQALAGALEEGERLLASAIPTVDVVRFHVAAARHHLAAGRTEGAWRSIRAAAALAGPEPSFHPYTIEAHAGIPEVCLALLQGGGAPGVDPAEVRATAATGLRRLDRYSRAFPMARPRARLCLGAWQELEGRRAQAVRSWAGAVEAAERLAMPWEAARGQLELGRQLAPGEDGPGGLDRDALLERAAAGFAAMGCRADVEAARDPAGRPVG